MTHLRKWWPHFFELFDRAIFVLVVAGCSPSGPMPESPKLDRPLRTIDSLRANKNERSPTADSENSSVKSSEPIRDDDWFEDVTNTSGILSTYRNGQEAGHLFILESLGGGAGLFDFDRDGNLDVFLTGGGSITGAKPELQGLPSALFRNAEGWQFSNVTSAAHVDRPGDYSHGCCAVDYDNDGFSDLLVTAYGRCRLFRNQGDGSFDEVSDAAGIDRVGWWTGAAWGDVDHDGFSDLLVTAYVEWSPATDRPCRNSKNQREVCSPNRYAPANDCLYRNRGDGTFVEAGREFGLVTGGNGLGVIAAELNGDGLVDFYVANDESDNFLYLGNPDGKLSETAQSAGVAVNQYGTHEGSMGLDAGDYDRDGRPDLWVTNFEHEDNALYRNLGGQMYSQTTNQAGLAGRSRLHVGFGTAMEDFNGDGWLDLLVINGHVFYGGGQLPYRQHSQLFQNGKNGRFDDVSSVGGGYFRADHSGRGAAIGDLDNDGRLDFVVVHQNDPAAILRNRTPAKSFIRLELIGTQANRDAIGAVVTTLNQSRRDVRFVKSGAGYFSQFDRRVVLSGVTASVDFEVRWPAGRREVFRQLSEGQTHVLVQGKGLDDAVP